MTVRPNQSRLELTQRPGIVHLAVVLAYCALTLIMTWPLAIYAATAIPGDGFDGWQNYWNLWWLKTALIDRVSSPFVTDILYYPTGVGLYFHTLNPLNGLLSMPVQLVGGLIPAYNAVVLISWAFSGYGAFLLCLWLLGPAGNAQAQTEHAKASRAGFARYAGAFLAGTVYAFAPFHMAHLLGHMQVMSLEWIPFYVLYLLRGMSHGRTGRPWLRDAGMAGLFLIFNGLSDWYFVLYLFLFTALAICYFWLSDLVSNLARETLNVRQSVRSLVAVFLPPLTAGAIFALVLSPVLLPMLREASEFNFMVRPASDLYILSASLTDYLIPSRLHTLLRSGQYAFPGNQIAPLSERTIAVGYVVLALAIAAMALRRRRAAFWAIVGLFFVLLSLGPKLHVGDIMWDSVPAELDTPGGAVSWTPFAVMNRVVPFMRISRSVSRYALMAQLSAAMLAGIGLSAVMLRMRRRGAYVLAALALMVIIVEYWVAPYPLSRPDTPSFYVEVADRENAGAILNLPMNYDRPGYLLYQTVHNRPLTVAYISRDDPRTLTERIPALQHFRHLGPDIVGDDPAQAAMTVLNDLGVEYVVLDRYKMPTGKEREYTEELTGLVFAGSEPVFQDDRLTVYEVAPVEESTPYIELGPLNWGALEYHGEGGAPSRSVVEGLACFTVRHAPQSTVVMIDYRSDPDAVAELIEPSGKMLAELEPAVDGNTVSIDLTRVGGADQDVQLCIRPSELKPIYVDQIHLHNR